MTDEEMAKQFADGYATPDVEPTLRMHLYECSKKSFLAGLITGRPQWHKVADGDLPEVHLTVLNEIGDQVKYRGEGKWEEYSGYYEEYVEVEAPIAWCEMPKYTEEAGK